MLYEVITEDGHQQVDGEEAGQKGDPGPGEVEGDFLRRDSLQILERKEGGPEDGGEAEQEGEAGGGLGVDPLEQQGGDCRPGAGDPREDGETLHRPDDQGIGEAQVLPLSVITSYSIHYTKLYEGPPFGVIFPPGVVREQGVGLLAAEAGDQDVAPALGSYNFV